MNVGLLALLGPLAAAAPTTPSGPVAPTPPPGLVAAPPARLPVAPSASPVKPSTAAVKAFLAPPVSGPVPPYPQFAPQPYPGTVLPQPAPVLAAKVLAPEGVRVTIHPGTHLARLYTTPTALALRPGYAYRLELTNLPYHPGKALYPIVEVRGTLVPRPNMRYTDYPVPLLFTAEDIDHVMNGAVVAKAIYLEDPEKALPQTVPPDKPVEFPAGTEDEAIRAATENGRLVVIVRMGSRTPSESDLRMTAVEGTVLPPGEKYLKTPVRGPILPWFGVPMFDPILGPKPAKEECFTDGCDTGPRLGIGPYGRLGGLNPTDVGVEYTVGGARKVTTSNQVCICVPRFMIQRAELAPTGANAVVNLAADTQVIGRAEYRDRVQAMAEIGRTKPGELDAAKRPQVQQTRTGTAVVSWFTRPRIVGQVIGVEVRGAYVEPEELTNTGCLTVTKSVDPAAGVQVGDVVTFTIKYTNNLGKPISDVVLSDSLSGRLEYVVGSAQADRPGNFATAANEAGSSVLRWDFPGRLLPGQGGVVKFQARVR